MKKQETNYVFKMTEMKISIPDKFTYVFHFCFVHKTVSANKINISFCFDVIGGSVPCVETIGEQYITEITSCIREAKKYAVHAYSLIFPLPKRQMMKSIKQVY